jgi:hypothetical protein
MFVIASKIFSFLLAAIVISKSYVDFRAKAESFQIFVFWTITWATIVVVALFPSIIDVLILSFGGGRTGLGTFFGMGLVFLFFIVYRMYVKVGRIEQNLMKTIQELALRDQWTSKHK